MAEETAAPDETKEEDPPKPICGIVMPISAINGCSEAHWLDVRQVITESVTNAGFCPRLVSDADDVGVIQKRIVQNLTDDPIVVCDVSGRNPNVMFELGMRLTFDKPTVIIKDDLTNYAFDTSPMEHLGYPRDLRYSKILNFKILLTDKLRATFQKSKDDPHYSQFLDHFGKFTVPHCATLCRGNFRRRAIQYESRASRIRLRILATPRL